MNESKTPLQSFDPYSFGKRLHNLRKACGVTQEELAVRLCVDRGHIARIERGSRACSIDLLVEIAALLDVSTDYLLVGTATDITTKQKLITAIEELNKIAQSL